MFSGGQRRHEDLLRSLLSLLSDVSNVYWGQNHSWQLDKQHWLSQMIGIGIRLLVIRSTHERNRGQINPKTYPDFFLKHSKLDCTINNPADESFLLQLKKWSLKRWEGRMEVIIMTEEWGGEDTEKFYICQMAEWLINALLSKDLSFWQVSRHQFKIYSEFSFNHFKGDRSKRNMQLVETERLQTF